MFKKALTAIAVAGVILLSGVGAANTTTYPPNEEVTVSQPSILPGGSVVITITGLDALNGQTITFTVTAGPAGASLSSIVFAATGGASVDKVVSGGSASATFTASTPGAYTVTITDAQGTVLGTTSVTVTASGSGAGGGGLAPTGGTVPAAAVWLGAGAIGIGGLAVTAVAARRRARKN